MLEKLHKLRPGSLKAKLLDGHRRSTASRPSKDVRQDPADELEVILPTDWSDDVKSESDLTCIERLERKCKRKITIETKPSHDSLKKCHLQEQSPLWKLPPEIRNVIFDLVTIPELVEHAEGYAKKVDGVIHTNVMKTCRRAWLEINENALAQTELHFSCSQVIFGIGFSQDPRQDARRLWDFLHSLTENNRKTLDRLRISAPLWWFEAPHEARLPTMLRLSRTCPRVLTLVVSVTPELLVHVSDNGTQSGLEMGWLKSLLNESWPEKLHMIQVRLCWINGVLKQLLFGPQVNLLRLVIENIRKLELESSSAARRWTLQEPLEQDSYSIGSLESGFPKNVRSLVREHVDQDSSKAGQRSQNVTLVWKASKREDDELPSQPHAASLETPRLNRNARKCIQKWKDDNSLLKFSDEPWKKAPG
ncbi:hypothetical protein HII31_09496 [Pseudocercospora fuligena]|uniref:F-box domain-containing protein n=1 Tax=Pseudocercospora fuligena TaxID=685502 RepID=A0A8H6VIB0_9PEZI|nr:hypothetical protein HII31_09496 [Pseudocercospora fuligena]